MNPTLTTADGLTLRLRDWPLDGARGSVVIVHGLGEHIGRHAHVAAHLNDWGWRVVGYDQRGHGASEGARGALARDDDLLRDLALVIDAVRAEHTGPLILLGHSMGGLVAARLFVVNDSSLDHLAGGACAFVGNCQHLAIRGGFRARAVDHLAPLHILNGAFGWADPLPAHAVISAGDDLTLTARGWHCVVRRNWRSVAGCTTDVHIQISSHFRNGDRLCLWWCSHRVLRLCRVELPNSNEGVSGQSQSRERQ